MPDTSAGWRTTRSWIGCFDEVADAARRGAMDDEQLANIATRYGMEVTGPVPEGYA